MQRGELLVTIVLAALIVAGIAYDSLRGADKTADIVVVHPAHTPFDAIPSHMQSPQSATSATGSPMIQALPDNRPANANRLIDFINRASQAEIESLPGIGPALSLIHI